MKNTWYFGSIFLISTFDYIIVTCTLPVEGNQQNLYSKISYCFSVLSADTSTDAEELINQKRSRVNESQLSA